MWALKSSFLVSMSTMYLNFDRMKTRLECILHTLLVCESQRSLLPVVIPKRRCSDTWSIFPPFRTRSSGKGDNWFFCLVAIVIDLVLIGLMTIWLLSHRLDIGSKLSCILLPICRISFPDVCSVVWSANMSPKKGRGLRDRKTKMNEWSWACCYETTGGPITAAVGIDVFGCSHSYTVCCILKH